HRKRREVQGGPYRAGESLSQFGDRTSDTSRAKTTLATIKLRPRLQTSRSIAKASAVGREKEKDWGRSIGPVSENITTPLYRMRITPAAINVRKKLPISFSCAA